MTLPVRLKPTAKENQGIRETKKREKRFYPKQYSKGSLVGGPSMKP